MQRYVSTIGKNSLNSNSSSICPHNMVNFGLLTAEIGWRVWVTIANFNGFRVFASLLHRRRSAEVNHTLHDVWPSPGLVHYIYILDRGLLPLTDFCQVKNSLCIQVLRSPGLYWQRYCTALEQWASAELCGVRQRAPPIFGRAAITLGIGSHSSFATFGRSII